MWLFLKEAFNQYKCPLLPPNYLCLPSHQENPSQHGLPRPHRDPHSQAFNLSSYPAAAISLSWTQIFLTLQIGGPLPRLFLVPEFFWQTDIFMCRLTFYFFSVKKKSPYCIAQGTIFSILLYPIMEKNLSDSSSKNICVCVYIYIYIYIYVCIYNWITLIYTFN